LQRSFNFIFIYKTKYFPSKIASFLKHQIWLFILGSRLHHRKIHSPFDRHAFERNYLKIENPAKSPLSRVTFLFLATNHRSHFFKEISSTKEMVNSFKVSRHEKDKSHRKKFLQPFFFRSWNIRVFLLIVKTHFWEMFRLGFSIEKDEV